MVHEKNLNDLSTLYKKWGDQNPSYINQTLSADDYLATNKPDKKQRLWLELFSEMWNLNDEHIFYEEINGDDGTILNDVITKYIQKETEELE